MLQYLNLKEQTNSVGFEVITVVVTECSGERDAYMIWVRNPERKKPL
jgi:hypothetical protein